MPCTTILVGKNASYDGSTLVARNEDSSNGVFEPKRMRVVLPRRHARREPDALCQYHIYERPGARRGTRGGVR